MIIIRNKISKSRKGKYIGENSIWYGKHHTNETLNKIKTTQINNGNTKKIYQLDKDTYEIIKQYDSIASATKELNLSRNAIKNVLGYGNNALTAGGYAWKYIDKENEKYTDKYKQKIFENKHNKKHIKRDEILSLYDKGLSINELKEIGYSYSTIRDVLYNYRNLQITKMLSEKDRLIRNDNIIKLYLEGYKSIEIQKQLNLSRKIVDTVIYKYKIKGGDL